MLLLLVADVVAVVVVVYVVVLVAVLVVVRERRRRLLAPNRWPTLEAPRRSAVDVEEYVANLASVLRVARLTPPINPSLKDRLYIAPKVFVFRYGIGAPKPPPKPSSGSRPSP